MPVISLLQTDVPVGDQDQQLGTHLLLTQLSPELLHVLPHSVLWAGDQPQGSKARPHVGDCWGPLQTAVPE